MAQLADATTSTASGSETPRGPWGYTGLTAAGIPEGLMRRDDSDGYPSPPCQRQERRGILRDTLPIDPGTRRIGIYCRHPGLAPYPRVVVKANLAVGVQHDIEVVATASTESHSMTL